MSDDLEVTTEAAWTGFRARLADHVAAMGVGDELSVEYADDVSTSAPSIAVSVVGGDLVRVLDSLRTLTGDFEQRRSDELAVRVVRALREVYAVPHPAFLEADGLEVDPAVRLPASTSTQAGSGAELDDRELEGFPEDRDHLVAMVDAAMAEVFPDLRHDSEGDIPIVAGSSVLFVRVLPDRAAIELYAEIVLEPDAPDAAERLDHELALLNALHPLWKFSRHAGGVRMTHEMMARPFFAVSLRMLVRRFVTEVDQIASGLVVRVGGRLFLEPEPVEDERDVVMTGLLELLHLERVRAATVAGLFDHDRLEIIRQIVRIRRGEQSLEGHDEDIVLDALRKALRLVADGEPAARVVPSTPPQRSVQEPLLDGLEGLDGAGFGGDEALDLGWSA